MQNKLYDIPGCKFKILITSVCPECGMLNGQVGTETEIKKGGLPIIKYRRHHVKVDDEDLVSTPRLLCNTCSVDKRVQQIV